MTQKYLFSGNFSPKIAKISYFVAFNFSFRRNERKLKRWAHEEEHSSRSHVHKFFILCALKKLDTTKKMLPFESNHAVSQLVK